MKQQSAGAEAQKSGKESDKAPSAIQKRSVVFVSSAHPWTDNRIHYREAATLANAGYKVTLVAVDTESTATPAPGVAVQRIKRRSRAARFVLGTLDALCCALATDATIYHLHDPELIPAIPFLRLMGKTVIYDAHEDLPSQVKDKHYIPNKLRGAATAVAKFLVRLSSLADQVVAATEKIAESYPAPRVSVVRNFPPLRVKDSDANPVAKRATAAVYVGALSDSRGVPQMVRAAESFPEDWSLVIAGHSATPSYRDSLKNLPGWRRVVDRGVVSPDSARDLMLSARVGLVTLQRTTAYVDSLPTKMFEYMSAGIPVIASDFPLWREIIDQYECGIVVDETDPEGISAAVTRYAEQPGLLTRHGQNARLAAETSINWESQGQVLIRLYDSL